MQAGDVALGKQLPVSFFTGCAFLTYVKKISALNAQNALHERRTLPTVSLSVFSFLVGLMKDIRIRKTNSLRFLKSLLFGAT